MRAYLFGGGPRPEERIHHDRFCTTALADLPAQIRSSRTSAPPATTTQESFAKRMGKLFHGRRARRASAPGARQRPARARAPTPRRRARDLPLRRRCRSRHARAFRSRRGGTATRCGRLGQAAHRRERGVDPRRQCVGALSRRRRSARRTFPLPRHPAPHLRRPRRGRRLGRAAHASCASPRTIRSSSATA